MDSKVLANRIAANLGVDQEETASMVSSLVGVITKCLADGDSVAVPGFGSFETKLKAERVATHPSTGNKILVPPKVTVAFKPSALLKQKIRNS